MSPRRAPAVRRASTRRPLRTLAALVTLAVLLTAGATSSIRVKAGDTLWAIAHRHHISVSLLERLNHLPGNAAIYIGQLLQVPASGGGVVERGYTVRPGDTLSAIAQRFGVSVATIERRNRLPHSGMIVVGRGLAIPVAATSSAPGASSDTSSTINAGYHIPLAVQRSAAQHRQYLRSHWQPSPATVRGLLYSTARQLGVDPSLVLAVAWNESGFQEGVVSPVDAIGVMQVLPSTGRVLGESYGRPLNLLHADDNVLAGVLLLRELLRATGRADLALAGYYQGLGSLAAVGMLPQTHAYIRTVSSLRAQFRRG